METKKGKEKSLIERLGYPRDTKLLIVHADDLGMMHSVNAATIKSFETGLVNSGSVMVTCSHFPSIARYARLHPETDIGIHLTLTSEGPRWGPIASKKQVATLLDNNGYFHHTWDETTPVDPYEIETEIRAQIHYAYEFGIKPTHLDSHQFMLYRHNDAILASFLRVAREFNIPALIAKNWRSVPWDQLQMHVDSNDIIIDRAITLSSRVPPEKWEDFYTETIKNLMPGITELIIHPGYDDDEMHTFYGNRLYWGKAWRQHDFNYFTSSKFHRLLQENDISLITWREIGKLYTMSKNYH